MAIFHFSRRAQADLLDIGVHTVETRGEEQAARYLYDLEACCRNLAENPLLGRLCHDVRPDLRRMERGSHIIFYHQDARGIVVSRVLHERMLPQKHFVDDEDEPPANS